MVPPRRENQERRPRDFQWRKVRKCRIAEPDQGRAGNPKDVQVSEGPTWRKKEESLPADLGDRGRHRPRAMGGRIRSILHRGGWCDLLVPRVLQAVKHGAGMVQGAKLRQGSAMGLTPGIALDEVAHAHRPARKVQRNPSGSCSG